MRYASIRDMDITNGEGIGVALFVQGCPYHCPNCFNPETWDFQGGKEWTEETEQTFFNLIKRPHISRVSMLGGEPLAEQSKTEVLSLVSRIKTEFPDISVWLWTGSVISSAEDLSAYKDIDIIVDGRYIDSQRDITLRWRGSKNQRVIDVGASLAENLIILKYD